MTENKETTELNQVKNTKLRIIEKFLTGLIIVFCVAGCSIFKDKNAETKTDVQLTGSYWKLVEISGEKVEFSQNPKEAHIVLNNLENRISGNSGCNSFSGEYELLLDAGVRFSKVASTKMACINMATENQMFQMFEKVSYYAITADTLLLFDAEKVSLAKFEVVYLR